MRWRIGWPLRLRLRDRRRLLAPGVEVARIHMRDLRNQRAADIGEPLREGLRKVKRWHDQRLEDFDRWRDALVAKQGKLRSDQEKRLEGERNEVSKRHQARRDWITEGMQTVPEPYLRVAAVLIPQEVK